MVNQQHLDLLKQGVDVWNKWRKEHRSIQPDFDRINLHGADLSKFDLRGVNLCHANLSRANLTKANLSRANLTRANLSRTDLTWATLAQADLSKANLRRANLTGVNMVEANLISTDFGRANLTGANLSRANMIGCFIYAIAAWDVRVENTIQSNLIITRLSQYTVTVDNLEVAQFIYLLLNNRKIRDVIDIITSKVVLILGRFTSERKVTLDAIRDELRKQNYSPVLFDFEKPASRDLTETVSILAHLACFIIVDLTDPSSAPHEVATIIPQCVVPVQPLLLQDDTHPRHEYTMFEDLRRRHHWVLPTFRYQDTTELLASLKEQIIAPAEQKARELTQPK